MMPSRADLHYFTEGTNRKFIASIHMYPLTANISNLAEYSDI